MGAVPIYWALIFPDTKPRGAYWSARSVVLRPRGFMPLMRALSGKLHEREVGHETDADQ